MSRRPLDPARIVGVLAAHDVEYLLVGGVAAHAHGATRATIDFDCLALHQPKNLARLCAAPTELNARLRIEGISDDDAIAMSRGLVHPEFFARAEITTWMTDAGPVDILQYIPAGDGTRRVYGQLVGSRVRVVALDDIIASKEWANRPKDLAALPELRTLTSQPTGSAPEMELPRLTRTEREPPDVDLGL